MENIKDNMALVVVDWLNDFAHPDGVLYTPASERIRQNVVDAVSYSRRNDVPIVYTNDAHDVDDPEFETIEPHAIKGTWGADLIDLVPDTDDAVFEKKTFNAFTNPQLAQYLNDIGVEYVVGIGLITNICVLETVKGALENGFTPYVIEDAIGELDGADLEADLGELGKYAKLVTLDEFRQVRYLIR